MSKQVLQFLCAQVAEWKQTGFGIQNFIKIRVESNSKILRISEGQFNQLTLPLLDPVYLNSHFVTISLDSQHSHIFIETVLEVLQILNENFPAHLHFTENLRDSPDEKQVKHLEMHRRHTSFLNSLQEESSRQLRPDEVRDIMHVF